MPNKRGYIAGVQDAPETPLACHGLSAKITADTSVSGINMGSKLNDHSDLSRNL